MYKIGAKASSFIIFYMLVMNAYKKMNIISNIKLLNEKKFLTYGGLRRELYFRSKVSKTCYKNARKKMCT